MFLIIIALINIILFIIYYYFCLFLFLGIVTVQYCEDESGYIKLVAQPHTTCTEINESSHNDQDTSITNDQISIDNNQKKPVQLVNFDLI